MAISMVIVGARDAQLEELVRATGLSTQISWAPDLTELSSMAARQPNVLLVDLRGGSAMPPALTIFRRRHPTTGVVLLASALDPMLMLEAMRAGVNECVAEPLSVDDLSAAIGRVMGKVATSAADTVFAFVGAKGGVGTTTTAVNVATALAKMSPAGTLFIDLHLAYGDAAVFMGAEPRYSIADALENLHRFDETYLRSLVVRTSAGVDLLASGARQALKQPDAAAISSLVANASSSYAYTVLDVPRDPQALEALDHASTIVIVTNQELATVRNAGRIASALRLRYGKSKITTIVNRTDHHAEIAQEDIERVVGGPIAHRFPSDYRRALEAMNKGRPLALENHNDLSASFKRLAGDLAGLKKEAKPAKQVGFFGRLSGRKG